MYGIINNCSVLKTYSGILLKSISLIDLAILKNEKMFVKYGLIDTKVFATPYDLYTSHVLLQW